jgi:hypothetical protein
MSNAKFPRTVAAIAIGLTLVTGPMNVAAEGEKIFLDYFARIYPLKIIKSPIKFDLPMYFSWHKNNDNDPAHVWLRNYLIDLQTDL